MFRLSVQASSACGVSRASSFIELKFHKRKLGMKDHKINVSNIIWEQNIYNSIELIYIRIYIYFFLISYIYTIYFFIKYIFYCTCYNIYNILILIFHYNKKWMVVAIDFHSVCVCVCVCTVYIQYIYIYIYMKSLFFIFQNHVFYYVIMFLVLFNLLKITQLQFDWEKLYLLVLDLFLVVCFKTTVDCFCCPHL